MSSLNSQDRIELNNLLSDIPELQTEAGRRQIVELAGLSDFVPRMNLAGSTGIVLGTIVTVLEKYGQLENGEEALGKFLVYIKTYIGLTQKKVIERLLDKYELIGTIPAIKHTNAGQASQTDNQSNEQLEYQIEEQSWYCANFPETEEVSEEQLSSIKSEIDVVLITATDIELNAVANLLKPLPQKEKIVLVFSGPETYYIGKFGAIKTVVTKCDMGSINEGSVIFATVQAQSLWNPKAIIMVGIAFGKDPRKQKIGDVLVASQIISYEQQRVGETQDGKIEIISRGTIPPSNAILLNRFKNVPNWKFTCPDGTLAKIRVGPILSGEKLVDNPTFKAQLFKHFPQSIGGEMEGAGLCAASGRVGTAWILVKSICDWGDGKKHKKHQPLAAAAAADLVHHVFSQRTVFDAIPQLKVSSQLQSQTQTQTQKITIQQKHNSIDLRDTLKNCAQSNLNEIIDRLDVPIANRPAYSLEQSERVNQLITWAKTEPGRNEKLEKLREVSEKVLGVSLDP